MKQDYYLVLCTCPDTETAEALAGRLVQQNRAACVNIVPQLRSLYQWQGRIENDEEVLMLIKTTAEAYPALERSLQADHPYEVPEIIAIPLAAGLDAYLQWMTDTVKS